MAHVNEILQYLPPTGLSTSGMSHTCLYFQLLVITAFGRYSFSVPLMVEGLVGPSGWLQTEVVYLLADGHPSQY